MSVAAAETACWSCWPVCCSVHAIDSTQLRVQITCYSLADMPALSWAHNKGLDRTKGVWNRWWMRHTGQEQQQKLVNKQQLAYNSHDLTMSGELLIANMALFRRGNWTNDVTDSLLYSHRTWLEAVSARTSVSTVVRVVHSKCACYGDYSIYFVSFFLQSI